MELRRPGRVCMAFWGLSGCRTTEEIRARTASGWKFRNEVDTATYRAEKGGYRNREGLSSSACPLLHTLAPGGVQRVGDDGQERMRDKDSEKDDAAQLRKETGDGSQPSTERGRCGLGREDVRRDTVRTVVGEVWHVVAAQLAAARSGVIS